MDLLIQYALAQSGLPYKWSGNNPLQGFDCSGFVQWILRAAGIDPPGRQDAQSLYNIFSEEPGSTVNVLKPGALVFYGKSVKEISHVAFCLSSYQVIEAGGGDHTTLTLADAAAKNACVRISLVDAHPGRIASVRPSYNKIGMLF